LPDISESTLVVNYDAWQLERQEISNIITAQGFAIHTVARIEPYTGWPLLIKTLAELKGVREVLADIFQSTLEVRYNRLEVDRPAITSAMSAQHFVIEAISKKERIGQKIIIPPNQVV